MSHGKVVWAREITGLIRAEQYASGRVRVWHHQVGSFYCTDEEAEKLFNDVEDGFDGGCINCGVVKPHDECGDTHG